MEPTSRHLSFAGIWLPLITPFRDGAFDEESFRGLVAHYLTTPIDGFIVCATTGEGMTLSQHETERVAFAAAEAAGGKRPVFLGLCGSDTKELAQRLADTASWPVDGYLITCPYYSRPSQEGLFQHFDALAAVTSRPIALYNIPYRTGVNLANETVCRLATARENIIGIKDCCADATQSFDLLRRRRGRFAVMTGEDALFFDAVTHGADGGILASAHVDPAGFAFVRNTYLAGDHGLALARWGDLVDTVKLLFAEPNPAPIKHWLWCEGRIRSPELRLPLTGVSHALAARITARVTASATPLSINNEALADLLALNNRHATELSWLDEPRLRDLLAQAYHARQIGGAEAFLLALDQDAVYDSPNFRWFCERYPRFIYIDRVVVDPAVRGRGHARRLYAELFEYAARAGHEVVVCEVNTDPPNPVSEAFHDRLGFTEVGHAMIHGGSKTVRYLARRLNLTPPPRPCSASCR